MFSLLEKSKCLWNMTSIKWGSVKFFKVILFQLNKCQLIPNFKNLLHHAWQFTHEENHGCKDEIKLRCEWFVDITFSIINLRRINKHSFYKDSHSIADASKNLYTSFKEEFKDGNDECFKLLISDWDIASLNSRDNEIDVEFIPKGTEIDNLLEDWNVES